MKSVQCYEFFGRIAPKNHVSYKGGVHYRQIDVFRGLRLRSLRIPALLSTIVVLNLGFSKSLGVPNAVPRSTKRRS